MQQHQSRFRLGPALVHFPVVQPHLHFRLQKSYVKGGIICVVL